MATTYFAGQETAQQRQLALEEKRLAAEATRDRLLMIGGFIVLVGILGLAAVLIVTKRDAAAVDLIELVVAVAGAAFGAYGLAARRHAGPSDSQV